MQQLKSYSFLDTQASLVGPGLALSLGCGAGNAEEGITVEADADLNSMTKGADGSGFHNLHADKTGHVTIRILKTSPVNGQLSAALALQRTSAANWGQNTLTITHTVLNDVITCQGVAFSKVPSIEYAKDGRFNEWKFDVINLDMGLGK